MGEYLSNQLNSSLKGLSSDQALKELNDAGFNELPIEKSRTFLILVKNIIKEPMFLLLLISAIVYLTLGDMQEGLILLAFVVVTLSFTLYQESKTERAIEALRDLTSPRSLVIRDGVAKRISSREIVCNDIVILAEGDRVPADGILISETNLEINESILTGEAIPVLKEIVGETYPLVYSSTLVVRGHGTARITAIGSQTKFGRIGHALHTIQHEQSTLAKQVNVLVTQLSILSFILSFLLILLYGFLHSNWLQAILAGIALAMAMLPQEYVVVMALFPALGAWRLSKIKVLTRRLSAIETLGAVSVLCVDKTGTLTENQMTVTEMYTHAGGIFKIDHAKTTALPEVFHTLVELSILASIENPYDSMEKAFHHLGQRFLANTEHIHEDWVLMREYGLTPELRAMSHVWKAIDRDYYVVAAKGSPEAIIDLCHLSEQEKNRIQDQIELMAKRGLRILGVAEAKHEGAQWPQSEHDFIFNFVGLVGLADPLRPEIFDSVKECHQAGIKIIMITGDYPATAQTIAKEAGLNTAEILTGEMMNLMSDMQLREKIKLINVCARISPEQKLKIVEALKANGEITAMTGDGVNDAPALKAAHVGIAMGARGTDVAREAASLILLDDNFTSIVKAVQMGRRIFENMQKSMTYILAIHIPIAGMALLPVIFNLPAMLYPMHIAFLELALDPACSLSFENEPAEKDIMKRPPRNTNALLMGKNILMRSLLQGFGALLIVMFAYYWGLNNLSENEARAFSFSVLVITNLALIFSNRFQKMHFRMMFNSPNVTLWVISIVTIVFLLLVLFIPFLARAFRFFPLDVNHFFLAILVGLLSIIWFELVKLFFSALKY